jgi:hypothetical protein
MQQGRQGKRSLTGMQNDTGRLGLGWQTTLWRRVFGSTVEQAAMLGMYDQRPLL